MPYSNTNPYPTPTPNLNPNPNPPSHSDSSAAALPNTPHGITPYQRATKRGYFEARRLYRSPTALKTLVVKGLGQGLG